MKTYNCFDEVPLTEIKPAGWLEKLLKTQAEGLTGHIGEAGYPYDTPGWGAEKLSEIIGFDEWWPYEQTGYWVDGALRCGYLLGDEKLIAEARKSTSFVLEHADGDGYLGPQSIKEHKSGNHWAHSVFFRALMAEYQATGDKKIIDALEKHYLNDTNDFSDYREICNIETMIWLYRQNGNVRLLEKAEQTYEAFNKRHSFSDMSIRQMLFDRPVTEHGVSFNEMAKQAAILYSVTGNKVYLDAVTHAYYKLVRDHMLISGVHSSAEYTIGNEPLASHEACDISDFTWSLGYLLMATGEVKYADMLEKAIFNAGMGQVTKDFKALQYLSCPNQVIAAANSNHNKFFKGDKWMSYRPSPGTQCCPGNINRFLPNFAARLWFKDEQEGIYAGLYSPSVFTTCIEGREVTIEETTQYPFEDTITFTVHTAVPMEFSLNLRIPGWCRHAQLQINGEPAAVPVSTDTFVKLTRIFREGDVVRLKLPMEPRLSYWPKNGVGIEYGPLVFSLPVAARKEMDREEKTASEAFPAWNLYPDGPWNYALELSCQEAASVKVERTGRYEDVWDREKCPLSLTVPARKVKGWALEEPGRIYRFIEYHQLREVDGNFQFTPDLPRKEKLMEMLEDKTEQLRLVPYGCTELRLTVFPDASSAQLPEGLNKN